MPSLSPAPEPKPAKSLAGKTLFITGASRGIGKAIALRAAKDGANIAIVGKTADPHPSLPGTVHTACEEVVAAGGRALACVADVRFDDQIAAAIEQTAKTFGGIDILINNASAISLTSTAETPAKRFDLMHSVNVRATFLCAQLCLPYLKQSSNAHILTLSPPLNLRPNWFAPHLAYTLSKYGMSLCTLGLSEELREARIAVNSLWPRTLIATSAVAKMTDGERLVQHARWPSIVADAAHCLLTTSDLSVTGQFLIDEGVLFASGVRDFAAYAVDPSVTLEPDLFVEG